MPEPPMPTKYSRRPARGAVSGGQARSPPRRSVSAASTRAIESIAARIAASRSGSASSSATSAGHRADLRVRDDDRAAATLEVARVQRLVVGGRVRVRDEDRRRPRRGELPDGAAGPARPRRRPPRARRRSGPSAASARTRRDGHAASSAGEVALAGDVQHGRPLVAPGRDRHLVERRRPGERPEDGDDRLVGAEAEAGPRLGAARAEVGDRDRAPDDLDLLPGAARDLVGEEELRGERRGQPVREAEVRVGLGERRGDPAESARRAPSARRRSRRRRGRRRAAGGCRIARQANGAFPARQSARRSATDGFRGKPLIANVSSSKPASGTSRDSTRSGLPANVTVAPRARSASPTASAGLM